ncbi:DUF551 domain-containing protein [Klebsiella pneumoniae]|uniref:DUF551 domain-containing protein n=1 Tax=Klebsiella pneumoniae TaxID=573 RepID=UPI000E2D4FE3|nr:Eaa1 [Klebsiella pneumoniae]
MTSKLTRERIELIANFHRAMTLPPSHAEIEELARMALAAMDSESWCLPLDYLQGHKDGLEWAAKLAEANHPETGDWLYDDPIELAKAIRKGPDMPPVQPVADSEPDRNPVLAYADSYRDMAKQGVESVPIWSVITDLERNIAPLYRHAQPAPVVMDDTKLRELFDSWFASDCSFDLSPEASEADNIAWRESYWYVWQRCRAAMLQELKKSAGTEAICRSDENVQVLHTKSPAQSDCCPAQNQGWIPVSERMPENDGAYLCWDNRYVTTYAFIFGAWQANQFVAKNITHWMPLPAAPQEVGDA